LQEANNVLRSEAAIVNAQIRRETDRADGGAFLIWSVVCHSQHACIAAAEARVAALQRAALAAEADHAAALLAAASRTEEAVTSVRRHLQARSFCYAVPSLTILALQDLHSQAIADVKAAAAAADHGRRDAEAEVTRQQRRVF
jgi:hypothetical protein